MHLTAGTDLYPQLLYPTSPEIPMKTSALRLLLLLLPACLLTCKVRPLKQLFPSTPREFYERDLRRQKLDRTPAGQAWLLQGTRVLADSLGVGLPYRELGYFGDSVSAHAYRFTLPAGRRLLIRTSPPATDSTFRLFVDLFKVPESTSAERVASLSKGDSVLVYGGSREESLLLRLQTGLGDQGTVLVSLRTEPVLGFPVAGRSRADIISFWGADREAGRRRHEGIDIRAPRGTPVVAAAPGFVSNVGTNNLGGKVISVSATGLGISLYYAHLDTQLVSLGQRVKQGDTLGTVGNTGNAITTAPHLHFGIYGGWTGARDPLPFVNTREEKLPPLPKTRWLGDTARVAQASPLYRTADLKERVLMLNRHAVVWVTGQATRSYRVVLPDGTSGYLAAAPLQTLKKQLSKRKASTPLPLSKSPIAGERPIRTLGRDETLQVLGYFNEFELIRTQDGVTGWVPEQPAIN
jgi:peptidoglycan LD-endopeptidase LytH